MTSVIVIGCGIVGATIAYELSQNPDLQVTVLERQTPAAESTGAALGVLMGVISHKTKGRAWRMRKLSLERYGTLIPELERATERSLACNRDGIVMGLTESADLDKWQALIETRQQQGYQLELWETAQLQERCPDFCTAHFPAAVYSPNDRQISPQALTTALVSAAQQNGVQFQFQTEVTQFSPTSTQHRLQTQNHAGEVGDHSADWIVLASGNGVPDLTRSLPAPVDIRPVLGQAFKLQLPQELGSSTFQPVMTANDVHLVPLGEKQYWLGATVEFPADRLPPPPSAEQLDTLWQTAIAQWPALKTATILQQWSGLRPRPFNRPAPLVEPLSGVDRAILAAGHYRNGVLLAPATAALVAEMIQP